MEEDELHVLKIRRYQFLYRIIQEPFQDGFRDIVIYKRDDGAMVLSSMEDFEKYAKDKAYSYDKQWDEHKRKQVKNVK
jgi:hypothetical protein|nr:MAG TPA: hypothetical protein [Caudoviricetes sp.]